MIPLTRMPAITFLKFLLIIAPLVCGQATIHAQTDSAALSQSNVTAIEAFELWIQVRWPRISGCLHHSFTTLYELETCAENEIVRWNLAFNKQLGCLIETATHHANSVALLTDTFGQGDSVRQVSPSTTVQQNAYWTYYEDCDRWNVELTRTFKPTTRLNVKKESLQPRPQATELKSRCLASLDTVSALADQACQWSVTAWKKFEFISVETSVAASRPINASRD